MPKVAFGGILFIFIVALSLPPWAQLSLELIEKLVQNKFSIPEISWQNLKKEIASPDSNHYLLFDTRPPEEYQTSHLRSAIQVDPQMPAQDFCDIYGDTLKGKHAVFYCSAGYRSAIFAQRVQQQALASGARSIANLRGGIFRWYNEDNPVFDAHGETDNIHPYSSFWHVLLRERNQKESTENVEPN